MVGLDGFDAEQVEPHVGFDPLPDGDYVVAVVGSEEKPNSKGTGSYLELTLQVVEGDFKNRLLWDRLNLDNPNATTVDIASRQLSAICRAVGVMAPNDSVDLHNLPLVIHVRCKKRTDNGELVNEIKGYSKKESSPPPAAAVAAANSTPPWKRS